ncbi:hypothetical protein [Anaerostipes faecalis]|uniref:hypothetical protein n=1 Tax=Anaerostipes faecalis TaxID=2738446 RepID=UPI001C1DDEB5|nr:hypothetical protein [Anaerostipes faecalis]
MLETKKSTTLTGTVKIGDKQVVYLNASISSDGSSDNINQTIQDKTLYADNKAEVRKDIAAFTEEFYALQDAEATEE